MDLTEDVYPARTMKRGYQSAIAVAAGESLKIETTPGGIEVLDAECPAGKQWSVSVNVTITESNA